MPAAGQRPFNATLPRGPTAHANRTEPPHARIGSPADASPARPLLVLAACQAAVAGRRLRALDPRQVVDPTELVALVGGFGTANRLACVAAERGYRLERRDSLDGLGLELLTFRLPPGRRPGRRHRGAGAPRARRDGRPEPRLPRRAGRRRGADPRTYADALLGWPAAGCPAQVPVGIIDTAIDPGAPGLQRRLDHLAQLSAPRPGRRRRARHRRRRSCSPAPAACGARGSTTRRSSATCRGRARRPGSTTSCAPSTGSTTRACGVVNVSLAGPTTRSSTAGSTPRRSAAWSSSPPPATTAPAPRRAIPRPSTTSSPSPPSTPTCAPTAAPPRGDHIDFAAPGVDVFVPVGGGRYLTGTSISAPFVTALIAADPASPQPPLRSRSPREPRARRRRSWRRRPRRHLRHRPRHRVGHPAARPRLRRADPPACRPGLRK